LSEQTSPSPPIIHPVPTEDPPGRRAGHDDFGPILQAGGVTFRLWAPKLAEVRLCLDGQAERPMPRDEDGWFRLFVEGAGVGTRYRFRLPDGLLVPDPASRHQPDDVHGPSEVVDPAFGWTDGSWRGRPWREAVLYECHVGTFTPSGTFAGVQQKLDHLVGLGVTALSLMPVADFPGRWNWGYDGVLPYAPDARYGRPEHLKALVDAAHARGVMVLLDVVYNHFGPDGNYLPLYQPIFNESHRTPWGGAVNVDGEGSFWVREFIIQNALSWLVDYHLDGLRLDAVHAIRDDSTRHLLEDLAERARLATPGRHVHLLVENEENDPALLRRDADGGTPLYTAQWNDDVHHGLHVAVTGESEAYYADYAGDIGKLGRALAEGFAFQGETMPYRGSPRGGPSASLPPEAFVAFLQNHDQVGNRAFGDRIAQGIPPERLRAATAMLMLSPQIPMLFMGQEWAAAQPFPFFVDFEEPLAEAVRTGRREEFKRFAAFADPAARQRIPDPTSEATFRSAVLDWSALAGRDESALLAFHADLARTRRDAIVPLMPAVTPGSARWSAEGQRLTVTWALDGGGMLGIDANLADVPSGPGEPDGVTMIWREGHADSVTLGSWSVVVWRRDPA
jgi:malto-oligosyltrehalose trehalohydrolase